MTNLDFNNIRAIAGVVVLEMIRRKDFYVLFVLTALLVLLLGTVNVFDDDKIIRYLKEFCLLMIWISGIVIAITTAARQIPAERESRTIYPLLAKPASRSDVVVGKFLGCWLAVGAALVVFYLFYALICFSHEKKLPVMGYMEAISAQWIMLGIIIAMATLGSLVFAAPSSNATICFVVTFGLLFTARHLNKVALDLAEPARTLLYGVYFLVPQLGIFDVRDLIIHNHPAYGGLWWLLQVLYGLVYMVLFLTGACLVFRRQTLGR